MNSNYLILSIVLQSKLRKTTLAKASAITQTETHLMETSSTPRDMEKETINMELKKMLKLIKATGKMISNMELVNKIISARKILRPLGKRRKIR